MADERQRADDEMHDDGTVTSTMTADAIEYTISGEIHSGVGVLDKTVKILDALESGPATLGQLVSATGLARPTAHRLAIALERHRFVLRDQHGRFVLGSRFAELAAAAGEDRLLTAAGAKVVLGLPTPELQAEAAQIIADNQLNVRQAEALCKKMAKPAKEPREPAPRGTLPVEVEESLKQVLGSEVNVAYHGGKGKLTVHFYSDEQLRAFANLLGQYQMEAE